MYKQVVKLCVQALVALSKEEVPVEEAERYKTVATTVRSMAHRLDSGLIKVRACLHDVVVWS